MSTDTCIVIASFQGWNDAGEAASHAVQALIEGYEATKVADLDSQDFYDFQVNRPTVVRDSGDPRIEWPGTSIWQARDEESTTDVYLIDGLEPSIRWRDFCLEILTFVDEVDADVLVLTGALLTDVPHTRPLPVLRSSNSPVVRENYDAVTPDYSGPTGIVGVLAEAAHASDVDTLSLWASVPHYVGHSEVPGATLALLHEIESLFGVSVDTTELEALSEQWVATVGDLVSDDPDLVEYVAGLEENQKVVDDPSASGDSIARDFEKFLRTQRGDNA